MKINKPKPFICGKTTTFEELNVDDYLYCYANTLQRKEFIIGTKYKIIKINQELEDNKTVTIKYANNHEMNIYYQFCFWPSNFYADDFFIPVKKT